MAYESTYQSFYGHFFRAPTLYDYRGFFPQISGLFTEYPRKAVDRTICANILGGFKIILAPGHPFEVCRGRALAIKEGPKLKDISSILTELYKMLLEILSCTVTWTGEGVIDIYTGISEIYTGILKILQIFVPQIVEETTTANTPNYRYFYDPPTTGADVNGISGNRPSFTFTNPNKKSYALKNPLMNYGLFAKNCITDEKIQKASFMAQKF